MTTGLRRLVDRRAVALRGHADDAAGVVGAPRDGGFILLEEIVSITLVMVVMAALATFFLTVTQSTSYQRAKQSAVQLANSQLNLLRGVPAADLTLGRSAAQVSSQFSTAPTVVQPWLAAAAMTPASDANATSTTALTLPMSRTAVANNITYTITNYLGTCSIPTAAASGTPCTTTTGTQYLRAVVAVTWPGMRCAAKLCSYVTATLVSTAADAQWIYNQSAPRGPVVADPGNQVSLVGSTVSLQLALQPNTGVAPVTWAITSGALPAGLSMTTAGLITGTPTTVVTNLPVTVVATDSFARQSPAFTFTWSVVGPPTVTGLTNPFVTTAGATIVGQTLPYTCPTSSCTYTVSGAPAGIGLSTSASGPFTAAVNTTGATSGNLYLGGTTASSLVPASTAYAADVVSQSATHYWRLDESSGATAADSVGGPTTAPLSLIGGYTQNSPSAILTNVDAGVTFDGSTGYATALTSGSSTATSSESVWFRTTSQAGGPLMALEDSTAANGNNDRTLYLNSAGQVTFGLYVAGANPYKTVTTTAALNDGRWHQAVGVLSGAGQSLYVDGRLVGTNAGIVGAISTTAYWHLGAERMSGWPLAPASSYLAGTIDDVSVYSTGLTLANIQQQYADSGRVPFTVSVASADTGSGIAGTSTTAAWTVVPPPTVTGLPTPFATTAGATIVAQPLPYDCPTASCTYTSAGMPAGIGVSTAAAGPFTATATVTNTNGLIYAGGTVSSAVAPGASAYANDVVSQGASNYWPLQETAPAGGGTGANAISGGQALIEQPGATHPAPGAVITGSGGGTTFDGSSVDGGASTQTPLLGPQTFSESVLFKTTTTSGGKLLGFGNVTSGLSGNYDRQIYMDNSGVLRFGTCSTVCPVVITTPAAYNDGQWHQAVGTLSGAGLSFYVDGQLIGTNTSVTGAQVFNGYWRLGGDNLAGWQGTSSSNYFAGTLDDASTYPTALTLAQIQQQYTDSGRVPFAVSVLPTDLTPNPNLAGTPNTAAWTVLSPPSVSGLTNPFSTSPGAAVASQALPYNCPSGSCTYTLSGAPSGVGLDTDNVGAVTNTVTVTATSGLIYLRGTVSASTPAGTSTVRVTPVDTANGVTGPALSAIWTVNGAPTVGSVPAGSFSVGQTIPPRAVQYTCPSGSCTVTLAGGPPGMGVATTATGPVGASVTVGTTSGTIYVAGTVSPTATPGSYTVTLTPTDTLSGVSGITTRGPVTVYALATVSGLTNPFATTAGATISPQSLAFSCPSGSCTISVSGVPVAIGLTAAAGTGTPAASLAVTGTSGTVYLGGTVATSVPTTTGTVTVSILDTVTGQAGTGSSATWTVRAAPTVTGLITPFTVTAGDPIRAQPLAVTCPTATCTYTLSGAPAGIGLSLFSFGFPSPSVAFLGSGGTIYLVGTVSAATPTAGYTVTVTPRETSTGLTGPVLSAAWAVGPPTVTGLTAGFRIAVGATITAQALAYTCPNGANAPATANASCTFTVSGMPAGIGLAATSGGTPAATVTVTAGSGTVYLVGTVGAVTPGTFMVVVTPRDTASATNGPTNSATWTVYAAPTVGAIPSGYSLTVGEVIPNGYVPVSYTCPTGNCTLTLSGGVTGIQFVGGTSTITVTSASGSVYLAGTVTGLVGNQTLTVTPTDNVSGANGAGQSGSYAVFAAPTVTGQNTPVRIAQGSTIADDPLAYTCPSASCTLTVGNAPSGIGLYTTTTAATTSGNTTLAVTATSGTVYLRGTVAPSTATGSFTVSVTPTATDAATGINTNGPSSTAAWTVTAGSTAYAADVLAQGATHYWRLGEAAGTTGFDSVTTGALPLLEGSGVGHGAPGALYTNADPASTFDGTANGSASTQTAIAGPQTFSESVWFKTTTTSGGKLLGFGNVTSGLSGNYDRQIYMDNSGVLRFGTCSTVCPVVITTPAAYNDGQWHQAVGTLSGAGLSFYVDGQLIGTNTSVTGAQVFNGYWRLGGDNLAGWQGTSSSNYFAGTLDDASTYPTALTLAQIQQQYTDSGRTP